MKPCVTISLVNEARGGPFVFWDDLPGACRTAQRLGFAAVEVFPPSFEEGLAGQLRGCLKETGLALAAVGTGGGWLKHRLTLTSADESVRRGALEFIKGAVDFAAPFGAAVIIGSMQGKADGAVSRTDALNMLGEALVQLGEHARSRGGTVLYEHLNRYETNLFNRLEDALPFVRSAGESVKILADLFHMNIEEADIPAALRAGGKHIGHIHFVDSNRRPAGFGHIDYAPIVAALKEINYDGYLSAEALPWPDSDAAARQTIETYRRLFPIE
jgi:sugar phosphate isomerase/epimerase